jgi:hypothetical protein
LLGHGWNAGTPEQFGWDCDSWLLPFAEFSKRMATTTTTPITNRDRFGIEKRSKNVDRGFWAVAKERMEGLLVNLPWDTLMPLPRELRVQLVKGRAKGAFSGAYEEAIIRSMGMSECLRIMKSFTLSQGRRNTTLKETQSMSNLGCRWCPLTLCSYPRTVYIEKDWYWQKHNADKAQQT